MEQDGNEESGEGRSAKRRHVARNAMIVTSRESYGEPRYDSIRRTSSAGSVRMSACLVSFWRASRVRGNMMAAPKLRREIPHEAQRRWFVRALLQALFEVR